jgi:outer membrane protein TolC
VSTRRALWLLAAAALAGCAVGPNYHRPSAPVPQRFKEAEGWKPAEPQRGRERNRLVVGVRRSVLDGLEKQIDISNQTLKASEASWREAEAVVSGAKAELFPTWG